MSSIRGVSMPRHCAYTRLSIASTLTLLAFAVSAFAQSPPTRTDSQQKEAAAQVPQLSKSDVAAPEPENKETRANDLKSEVESLKAENAAVRELLRKIEEQQKTLLDQVDRLQRRLDGTKAADVPVPVTNAGNLPADPAKGANAPDQPSAVDASVRRAPGGKQ